jgi:tRNA threonylcarbamoyladenosine modification (KEOPS) complex  Pcc1 subunit
MKSSSSKPSSLRLTEDDPEIMIKINQLEKDRNMEKLRGRINGYLRQLRTFKLIKNMEFKDELDKLEQFIKKISTA